ncbi:MAG: manganese efflux pump, partial [Rhodospirillales bacterium]|nr:manganese efflux pump [Rhodospirillales bacterium]
DIVTSALAIGLATFVMAAIGTWGARFLGQRFGRLAEVAGGLCLIGIGLKILIAHTLA